MLRFRISFLECIAWRLISINFNCQFFKTITNIFNSLNHYSGKNSLTEFWNCNEEIDRFYFEKDFWTKQLDSNSRVSSSNCCFNCFWSNVRPKCVSWMYNKITHDCYYSYKKLTSNSSKTLTGISTGYVSIKT
jgi:hypothetical protein